MRKKGSVKIISDFTLLLSSSSLFSLFCIQFTEYYGYPGYQYSTPRSYYDYTGGLSEEEQLERAVLNSLNERGRNSIAFCILSDNSY